MVDNQQQALAAVVESRQQGAQQRPIGQVETALDFVGKRPQRRQVGDPSDAEQRRSALFHTPVARRPAGRLAGEGQAQRIVVRQQGLQRRFQKRTVERLPRL